MPLPKKIPRARSAQKTKPLKDSEKRLLANRYRVEKKLGHGNFGTAWLVKDLKTKDAKDEFKVLKEISVGDLQPDETVDAMHEASLLRNLDHPGIVKFFDSFIDGEFFCIVTEYCEGGDLDMRIQKMKEQGKKIPESLIIEWLIQLLLAVQYMHSRKVLHRDLKSRNIFLRNNMIKIGDFGISRILMGTTDMASTFTGTPYYMSPEVLKHEGYNSKSDVWSVGCLLYELVCLQHAFEGQSLMGVMYKIVEGKLPEFPKGFSNELEDVFKKIMEKDPVKRPSAADALKFSFIEKQMEALKNTMMDKHFAKEQKDNINKESQQIALALKQNTNLEQIRRESELAKWKNMSPRERMRLRKQMKADEEARKIQQATQQQHMDNSKKYQEIRQNLDPMLVVDPPWMKAQQEGKEKGIEQVDHHPYTTPANIPVIQYPENIPVIQYPGDELMAEQLQEEEYEELLRTAPNREMPSWDDDEDIVVGGQGGNQFPQFKHLTVAADERPITPMKDRMVYDREHSSLDWKDGIPDSEQLANTYYSQFLDEFENDGQEVEEEEDEDDVEGTLLATVKAAGKRQTNGEEGEDEVGDLINCMQNALDRSETIKSQTLTDDTVVGAFGPTARQIKITNLRIECEKKMGKREFEAAYEYLKQARFGDIKGVRTIDEGKIMGDLGQLIKNPSDGFMVDQLLFLEEQAKMSQM